MAEQRGKHAAEHNGSVGVAQLSQQAGGKRLAKAQMLLTDRFHIQRLSGPAQHFASQIDKISASQHF
ncbi:hypothetical protein D3C72_1927250 [compost metagenome]